MHLPHSQRDAINWSAPWLAHLATDAQLWAQADDMVQAINLSAEKRRDLYSGSGCALHFIAQEALPTGAAYESHIFDTGGVPTRLNLHDLFNASVWFTFPQIKAVLNARQAAQINQHGIQHARGVARDALTLFDENAAILVTSEPSLSEALKAFNWHDCLVQPRSLWDIPHAPTTSAQAALYSFGHALMEKLVSPYKAICAHTWVMQVSPDWFALSQAERICDLDHRLSQQLQHHVFDTRDFCPLPILGVPHFWPDNTQPDFYNDPRVFRSGRTRLNSTAPTSG